METVMAGEGYLPVFIISFLAATLLSLGSKWLLAYMIISVAVALAGNYPVGLSI